MLLFVIGVLFAGCSTPRPAATAAFTEEWALLQLRSQSFYKQLEHDFPTMAVGECQNFPDHFLIWMALPVPEKEPDHVVTVAYIKVMKCIPPRFLIRDPVTDKYNAIGR